MSSPTAEHAYRPVAPADDGSRRLQDLLGWQEHSRLIQRLRLILPAAILGLLALLLGWAGFNSLIAPSSVGGAGTGTSIRMVNPRFFGRDQGGRPISVSASSAVRDNNQFQRIFVEKPVLVIGAAPSNQTTVSAGRGVYREDTRILTLDDKVHVRDSQGNDFLTSHAEINTLTDDVQGPARIAGHGPMGRITSATFSTRNGGAQIIFSGGVAAQIEQGGSLRPTRPAGVVLRGPR